MARYSESNRAATRWTIRIVPIFVLGAFGVTTYVVVARLCVQYLHLRRHRTDLCAGFLVLFFVFLLLSLASYFRILYAVQTDPGLVPLLNAAPESDSPASEKRWKRRSRRADDPEQQRWAAPDMSLDSPGLEAFYSKDVFVCEVDGRPKWCSECRQWKPDRAHHSSELGRCVRKMDHMCPWVGGMVSESSFNFFAHFTFYTACLCASSLAIGVYCLLDQVNNEFVLDGWIIAVLVIAAFFGLFSLGMALTAGRFIFINITNIDMLKRSNTMCLAVRIPGDTPPSNQYQTITYPLQHPQLVPSQNINARDQLATRKFAILRTEPRENPWDVGYARNWSSVMGRNALEWLLPLHQSPCCNHESMVSDYPLGAALNRMKKRYGVPSLKETSNGVEMHQRR